MALDKKRFISATNESIIDDRIIAFKSFLPPTGTSPSLNGGKSVGGLIFTNPVTGQLWVSKYVDGVTVIWVEKGSGGGGGGGAVDSVNGQTGAVTLTTANINPSTNRNYVNDAQLILIGNTSGTNTGDNATNTTSNAYADGKVAQTITNGVTTSAPSQDAVYDALQTKLDKSALGTPLNQSFTYTSGSQVFTLSNRPTFVYYVTVNGITLNPFIDFVVDDNTPSLTIINNTLVNGDEVIISYVYGGISASVDLISDTVTSLVLTWSSSKIDSTKQNTLVSGTNIRTVNGNTLLGSTDLSVGTVTTASVVSTNGFAGSVANAGTTPAITLSTTITGLVKGNGTAFSAAVAGTDYQAPITLTTSGTSGAATLVGNTLNIPQYSGGGTSYTFSTGLTNTSGTVTANLATGVAGGQSVIGGTASGNNLTLSSTSNATKGKLLFGISAYDEVNNALLIGQNTFTTGWYTDILTTGNTGQGLRVRNNNGGNASNAVIQVEANSPSSFSRVFKLSTTYTPYKNLLANDFGHYNSGSGNISFLNDHSSGKITFTAGGATATHWIIATNGNLSNTGSDGTATLHLKAGTASANTAPLKLTAGTNLTTVENGALEFDGSALYFTVGGVRKTVTLV